MSFVHLNGTFVKVSYFQSCWLHQLGGYLLQVKAEKSRAPQYLNTQLEEPLDPFAQSRLEALSVTGDTERIGTSNLIQNEFWWAPGFLFGLVICELMSLQCEQNLSFLFLLKLKTEMCCHNLHVLQFWLLGLQEPHFPHSPETWCLST